MLLDTTQSDMSADASAELLYVRWEDSLGL
jgi:hypothetical protein